MLLFKVFGYILMVWMLFVQRKQIQHSQILIIFIKYFELFHLYSSVSQSSICLSLKMHLIQFKSELVISL